MTRICQIVIIGDSLSDRGTLDKRELLGFIPLSYVSGLNGKSPKGRFTNGLLWADYVSATTVQQFEINHQRRKLNLPHTARTNADLSDEFLSNERLREKNQNAFSLNDDRHVLFNGKRFARFYCEGGLTSYDYSWKFTIDPTKEFPRLILSTLKDKRDELFDDDKKYSVSHLEKAETLIIEWSGANDLITVNAKPTRKEVDRAVSERILNIEKLVKNGYRNFVLFNQPDLALTPRYQAKSKKEQDNASKWSEYFNTQLATKCAELNNRYKALNIPVKLSVFDVAAQFKEVYFHPEQYKFDQDKLKTPYTKSADFEKNKKNPEYEAAQISPSEGYMFWDDVHPTADMHSWLAEKFKELFSTVYNFIPPINRKLSVKEESDIRQKNCFFKEEEPKSKHLIRLPDDVVIILERMHVNAKLMCLSTNPHRREKGELLKNFIFELKCHRGDLKEIHGFISAFTLNKKNMNIIKAHENPVFDFFTHKKTTRSEDTIAQLADTINTHLNQVANKMSI